MKCPKTNEEPILSKEPKVVDYRKQNYEIVYHQYVCEESQAEYITDSLETVNKTQVLNQYRVQNNIPFPHEITEIRERYGLSATKMSEVLGFGVNSYRQYESGEMPSIANAKLIKIVDDPHIFIKMVELCSTLEEKHRIKYIQNAQSVIVKNKENEDIKNIENYLLGGDYADIYTGYRKPDLQKLIGMLLFFTEKTFPSKAKMNLLLFYADFLMFKQTCYSISGMRYKAVTTGPVLNNFLSIFEFIENNKGIKIYEGNPKDEKKINQVKYKMSLIIDSKIFSEEELHTLNQIALFLKNQDTEAIINHSKSLEAWKSNEKEEKLISYKHAFNIKGLLQSDY